MPEHIIWIILLGLPPAYTDSETWGRRSARMHDVASAIHTASSWATCSGDYRRTDDYPCDRRWARSQRDLALLLVTLAWWESRLARNVHEGRCQPWECDATRLANGTIYHRARSLWQVQRTSHVHGTEWADMVGTGERPTGIAAVVASRALGASLGRCRTIEGAIASYAGAGCTWRHAGDRALFWRRLRARSNSEHYTRMLTRASSRAGKVAK